MLRFFAAHRAPTPGQGMSHAGCSPAGTTPGVHGTASTTWLLPAPPCRDVDGSSRQLMGASAVKYGRFEVTSSNRKLWDGCCGLSSFPDVQLEVG